MLVFTIDLPEIFICSVAAIIRTYLQNNYREDFFVERNFNYELLRVELPHSITDSRAWTLHL